MKLVQIHLHFEYGETIEALLDRHKVVEWVRYPMTDGRDREGKHFGSQIFPGNFTVVQALVDEDVVPKLFAELQQFREHKPAHWHLQALVMPVEQLLVGPQETLGPTR